MDEDEKEDFQIKPTDSLLIAAKIVHHNYIFLRKKNLVV